MLSNSKLLQHNMLASSSIFAMHVIASSFQGIRAVGQVLGYTVTRNVSSSSVKLKAKINFNTKHLSKGDPLPPYNGKLRLYNMRYCPFAQRAVLALNVKNIDYEVINIDLKEKPEWLASKSVLTKVPALEISDRVSIYESLVIVEYLEDVYPQRPLFPKDPVKKAFDKILVEICTPPMQRLAFKLVMAPEKVTEDVVAGHRQALDFLQNELQQRGTKFLDGGEPGYADYMIWPWLERLPTFNDKRIQIYDKLLLEYIANMSHDPVVKEYAVPREIFQSLHEEYVLGKKPNYDRLLEE